MSKRLLSLMILFELVVCGFALDFSIRPRGFAFIPLGESGASRYTVGGGGDIAFDVDIAGIFPNPLGIGYTAGIEGGLALATVAGGAADPVSFYSVGGGFGVYYFPLSRLFLRLDGGVGAFVAADENERSPASLWWQAGGEAGFRFTPSFILSASGGFRQYTGNSGLDGIYAGLALRINVQTDSGGIAGVDISVRQDGGIFPLYLSLYQRSPAATLKLRNLETAEIRNVRVSFRAAGYTSSEFNCGDIPLIAKGRTAEIPLYADFAPALLNLTENGRIVGEAVIRYSFLGKEKTEVRSAAIDVYNRNSFPSGDMTGLAAFVSPTSPEVLEYAKYSTGVARTKRRSGLNPNMQFAVYLFQGLLENKIRVKNEQTDGAHNGTAALAEAQFPGQTMAYRTGSSRDMGLLYMGVLSASGIKAAFIPLDDDFLVVVSLNIAESAANGLFSSLDKLLVIDDEVWMPLSMAGFNDGFLKSWHTASDRLNQAVEADEDINFITLEDAWAVYPPAPFPAQGIRLSQPEQTALVASAESIMNAYVREELQPKIADVQRQIRNAPASQQAALYNQLGSLQLRTGNMADAKASYERAAGMGSLAGMLNRGSVAMTEKDYTAAARWFNQALALQPDNEIAKRGLAQITEERRN